MNCPIKASKIKKAKNAATMLRLRNTRLMVEGLAAQLYDFEGRTISSTPRKAKRIMDKIACIEGTMENELATLDSKKVRAYARDSLYMKLIESTLINFAAGAFAFMLPELSQMQNIKLTIIIKAGASLFFGVRFFKEVWDTIREAGDYKVDGMIKNIQDFCEFSKRHVEKAVNDVRDSLDEIPPI
jgi:hypothetical protein